MENVEMAKPNKTQQRMAELNSYEKYPTKLKSIRFQNSESSSSYLRLLGPSFEQTEKQRGQTRSREEK